MIGFRSKNTLAAGAKHEMSKALRAVTQTTTLPYDGVNGSLPDWMPKPLQLEFEQIRHALFGGVCPVCDATHTPMEIMHLLKAYRRAGGAVSIAHERDLRDLEYIRSIEALGPEKGLDAYLGKGSAEIYRRNKMPEEQRAKASKPRGGDGLTRVIGSILQKKPRSEKCLPYVKGELEKAYNSRITIDDVTIESYVSQGPDEVHVEWHDAKTKRSRKKSDKNPGRAGTTDLSGLKGRIHRIRRKSSHPTETTRQTRGM